RPDGGKGPSRTLWYRRRRMQTALQRRQRHRRNVAARRGRGGSAARRAALAIPLLLFSSFLVLGGVGLISTVSAYAYYSNGLPDPAAAFADIEFEQPSVIYDRTGQIELARFGELRRELHDFGRGQGLLDEPRLRHRGRGVSRAGYALRAPPRRLDDHAAARAGEAAPRLRLRGLRL